MIIIFPKLSDINFPPEVTIVGELFRYEFKNVKWLNVGQRIRFEKVLRQEMKNIVIEEWTSTDINNLLKMLDIEISLINLTGIDLIKNIETLDKKLNICCQMILESKK